LLVDYQFTPVGGCQEETTNGQQTLWAFDALNKAYFLKVEPEYAIATVGEGSVVVTVTDGTAGAAIAGATIGGFTTDANGQASITVPSAPECYQMKAERSDSIRSNAF
jgi:hypothetical protein